MPDDVVREREITTPTALCLPDGRLNRGAVGWTRHPLHRTDLRGWGRNKRWEYWGLMTPTHVIGITVSSLDYAAVHQVWVLDRRRGTEIDDGAVVPLGRGTLLPESLGRGAARARARGLSIDVEEAWTDGDGSSGADTGSPRSGVAGTRIRVRTGRVEVDVVAGATPGHEALGVVVPWSDRRFQYTVKDVARPLTGTITVDGELTHLGTDAWGVLDHGRGRWPYSMTWNWGAGSGRVDGHVVGVQVGGRWTDGTGSTENALLLDGRLHKNGDELVWEYDHADWLAPWRVHDRDRARVDLTFHPFHERVARTNLLVVAGETHQCFGTWTGWMTTDAGERITVDGVEGWAEEARNRW
ncbi:DUF2804 domain-containing protein [Actinotalea fermentans]|uniref:DUF2804 domain-containing protein n=1 Tax=Actinotalea fermentans TaxID=43671 RepID=UPI0021C16143|nr:DUF2804 domain-containing protein [Actinotalea fermentans]